MLCAVAATLCCCPPLGLLAVISAAECRAARKYRDAAEAQRKSKAVSRWMTAACVVGIVVALICVGLTAFLAMFMAAPYQQ